MKSFYHQRNRLFLMLLMGILLVVGNTAVAQTYTFAIPNAASTNVYSAPLTTIGCYTKPNEWICPNATIHLNGGCGGANYPYPQQGIFFLEDGATLDLRGAGGSFTAYLKPHAHYIGGGGGSNIIYADPTAIVENPGTTVIYGTVVFDYTNAPSGGCTIVPVITGNQTPCIGNSTTYTTASGKSNYVWNVTGGTISGSSTGNSINVIWSAPGSVSVQYQDGATASTTTSYSVTASACGPITASISGTTNASNQCTAVDGSMTIAATGGDGTGNYYFSFTHGSTTTTAFSTSPKTFTGLAAGSYTVSVQDAKAVGAPATDVNQTANGYTTNYPTYVYSGGWAFQSFTAGKTGNMTEIDMGFDFTSFASGTGTLNIYSGTGTSGTLLATQSVNVSGNGYFTAAFPLTTPVAVTSGQVYTFQFTAGSGMPSFFYIQSAYGPYTGGFMETSTWPYGDYGIDMTFKTIVTDAPIPDGYLGTATATINGTTACANIVTSASTTNATNSCNIADGKITISASGGDGSNHYFFTVSGPQTASAFGGSPTTISGLLPGTYNITVTDQGTSTPAVDVSQLTYYNQEGPWGTPGESEWQSFTAGKTGLLTEIDFGLTQNSGAFSGSGVLSVYSGQGTTGTLLTSQTVSVVSGSTAEFLVNFPLNSPVSVTAGQVYTFSFAAISGLSNMWLATGATTAGVCKLVQANGNEFAFGYNWVFKTYVALPGVGTDPFQGTTTATVGGNLNCGPISASATATGVLTNCGANNGSITVTANSGGDGRNNYYYNISNGTQTLTAYGASPHTFSSLSAGTFSITVSDAYNVGVPTLDQYQTADLYPNWGISSAAGNGVWQSFTAGKTGNLSEIDLGFWNTYVTGATGTLKIYSGTGMTGTVLLTQTVQVTGSNTFIAPFVLNTTVPVVAGNVYTFSFSAASGFPSYGYFVQQTYFYGNLYGRGQFDVYTPSGSVNTGGSSVFNTYVNSTPIPDNSQTVISKQVVTTYTCQTIATSVTGTTLARSDCYPDGTITVTASQGNYLNSYYYVLKSGSTTLQSGYGANSYTFYNVLPGPYTITVFDASSTSGADGFSNSTTTTVGSSTPCIPIDASAYSAQNSSTDCSNDGSITVTAQYGNYYSDNYYYVLTGTTLQGGTFNTSTYGPGNGAGTTIPGLPAGNYTVQVFDYNSTNNADGFMATLNDIIVLSNNTNCGSPISASAYSTANAYSSCSADGSIQVDINGGGDGANQYNFTVSGPTPSSLTQVPSGTQITGLLPGSYSITIYNYTSPDGYDGQSTTVYADVAPSNPATTPSITPTSSLCTNTYFDMQENSGNYYTAYNWSADGGGSLPYGNSNSGTQTFNFSSAGTVYLTATDAYGCASNPVSYYISPNTAYTPNISSSDYACVGGSYYNVSENSGYGYTYNSYNWNTDGAGYMPYGNSNSSTETFGFSYQTYTNFYLTVTDYNNCTASATLSSVYPNSYCGSTISAYVSSTSNENCPGSNDGSITVYATGGDGNNNYYIAAYNSNGQTYTGSSGGGNYPSVSGLPAGYYYYIYVYDANNSGDGYSTTINWYGYINDNNGSCNNGSTISAYISGSGNESCPGSNDGYISVQVTGGGDGSNNFYISAYNSNGNWYTSGNSNGSTSLSVNVPYGYYYYVNVYDANNPSDPYSTSIGWYSYIYDNNSSCGSTISAYISGSGNENCPGSNDGYISVQVTGGGDGSNNFYISAYNSNGNWYQSGNSNGSTSISVNTLPAGYYYYVNVYDANNPSDPYSTSIGWYSYINDNNGSCGGGGSTISFNSYNAYNETCPGSNDGSIVLGISGGDGSNYYYGYVYDNYGQYYYAGPSYNSLTFSGLPSGRYVYYAYVYDYNNGGSDGYSSYYNIYNYVIGDNNSSCGSPISFNSYTAYNESCPGSNDGSIVLGVSGGDNANYYGGYVYDNYGQYYYANPNPTSGNTLTFSGMPAGHYIYYAYVYDWNNQYDGYANYYNIYSYPIGDNNGSCGSAISFNSYNAYNESCPGSNNGSIVVNVTGGDGSNYYSGYVYDNYGQYYYPNSNPTSGNDLTFGGLPAGHYIYYVYVYDNNNQYDGYASYYNIYNYVIGDNSGTCGSPISIYSYSANNETCPGSNDGSLTLNVSGGDGSSYYGAYLYDNYGQYYYANPTNGGSVTIGSLPAGRYIYWAYVYDYNNSGDGYASYYYFNTYLIGDNYGYCGSTISASVSSVNNETCPGSNDGSLTVYATAGDGNNNYYISVYDNSNGQTYTGGASNGNYPSVSGLPGGHNYGTVYVYDNNNPSDGYATSFYWGGYVYDNSPTCSGGGTAITFNSYTPNNESCPGSNDGSIVLNVSGGDGNSYYGAYLSDNYGTTYSTPNPVSGNTITFSGLPAGHYIYYAYVYDYNAPSDGYASYYNIYNTVIGDNSPNCGSTISASYSSNTNETCPGSNDGSLTVYATGGDGNNNYFIQVYDNTSGQYYSGNASNGNYPTVSGLPGGHNYGTVYVYDNSNSGDGFATSFYWGGTIYDNYAYCTSPISASVVTSGPASNICNPDGFILIQASGGDGQVNYTATAYESNSGTWYTAGASSNGSPYVSINLPAGYYTQITVSDAANPGDGLAYTFYPNLTIGANSSYCPTPISFSVTTNNASNTCPGTQDGSLTITVTGGDGTNNFVAYANNSYQSSAAPGSNVITISGLQAGDYSPISVYNADGNNSPIVDGLQAVDNSTYTVGATMNGCPIGSYISTFTSPTNPCDNGGVLNVTVYYGDGSGNYVANAYLNGSGTPYATVSGSGPSSGIALQFTGLVPGSYLIKVDNAASPNGSDGMEGSVTYNLQPSLNVCPIMANVNATPPTSCGGSDGSITVTVTGGGAESSNDYAVTVDGGSPQYTTLNGSVTFNGLSTGYYNILVYDHIETQYDGAALALNGTYVAPGGALVATITPTTSVCANSTGNVYTTESGMINYSWNISGHTSYTGGTSTDNTVTINWGAAGQGDVQVSYTDPSGQCGAGIDQPITLTDCGPNTWLGNSPDWNDGNNWSAGAAPASCAENVTVNSGTSHDPTISGNASVGDVTVNGNVTFNVGGSLSVCGNWTVATGASVVIGSGNVVLSGGNGVGQVISGTSSFQTLEINNSQGAALAPNADVSVYDLVKLTSGNLDVPNNANLTFKSTTTSQVGILDDFTSNNAGKITGKITAERFYGNAILFGQHMMGAPVGGITMAALGSNSQSGAYINPTSDCNELQSANGSPYGNVFSNHESNGSSCTMATWYVEPAGSAPVAGQGYSVVLTHPNTAFSVKGTTHENDSYTITGLDNSNWNNTSLQGRAYISGWALLSNPYLAPLNAAGLVADNSADFDQGIMVWNQTTASYQLATTIAPFQAFMVHRSTQGPASYVINGSNRTLSPSTFQRQQNPSELSLVATNTSTGLTDETTVGFNPAATTAYDAKYDLNKLPGALTRHTLYTLDNGTWMMRNILPSIDQTSTVTVGFEPGVSGTYSFDFNGLNSFDATSYITLEDTKTGTMHDVRSGAYTFTADATKDNWTRFVLHFTPAAAINTTDATCAGMGQINISQPGKANWDYTLTSTNNTLVSTGTLNQNSNVAASVAAGQYTLTLIDNNGYTVVKNITVAGAEPVTAAFSANTTTAEVSQEVMLTSTSKAAEYNWNFGDGATATGTNTTHSYAAEGVYNVSLTATSSTGCTSTTSHEITITSRSVTGINTVTNGKIAIWSSENRVYIDFNKMTSVDANIEMYNVLGQKLVNDKFTTSTLYTKDINTMEAGYVVVQVKNNNQIITQKVFIGNVK